MTTPFENVKAERLAVAGKKIAHLEKTNKRLCDENERLRDGLARAVQHLEYLEQSGRGDMTGEELASLKELIE